jgi:hypothetical protein
MPLCSPRHAFGFFCVQTGLITAPEALQQLQGQLLSQDALERVLLLLTASAFHFVEEAAVKV